MQQIVKRFASRFPYALYLFEALAPPALPLLFIFWPLLFIFGSLAWAF